MIFSRNRFFGFSLDISKHSQKILNWEHVTIKKSFLIGCYFIIPQKKKSLKHCTVNCDYETLGTYTKVRERIPWEICHSISQAFKII